MWYTIGEWIEMVKLKRIYIYAKSSASKLKENTKLNGFSWGITWIAAYDRHFVVYLSSYFRVFFAFDSYFPDDWMKTCTLTL